MTDVLGHWDSWKARIACAAAKCPKNTVPPIAMGHRDSSYAALQARANSAVLVGCDGTPGTPWDTLLSRAAHLHNDTNFNTGGTRIMSEQWICTVHITKKGKGFVEINSNYRKRITPTVTIDFTRKVKEAVRDARSNAICKRPTTSTLH